MASDLADEGDGLARLLLLLPRPLGHKLDGMLLHSSSGRFSAGFANELSLLACPGSCGGMAIRTTTK